MGHHHPTLLHIHTLYTYIQYIVYDNTNWTRRGWGGRGEGGVDEKWMGWTRSEWVGRVDDKSVGVNEEIGLPTTAH